MEIKLDWNTLPMLYNAKTKKPEDLEDLSNIKFIACYFEKNRKVEAIKNFTKTISRYIKLSTYTNGNVADFTNLPKDIREKISECRNRIKAVESYIDNQFKSLEDVMENNL